MQLHTVAGVRATISNDDQPRITLGVKVRVGFWDLVNTLGKEAAYTIEASGQPADEKIQAWLKKKYPTQRRILKLYRDSIQSASLAEFWTGECEFSDTDRVLDTIRLHVGKLFPELLKPNTP